MKMRRMKMRKAFTLTPSSSWQRAQDADFPLNYRDPTTNLRTQKAVLRGT